MGATRIERKVLARKFVGPISFGCLGKEVIARGVGYIRVRHTDKRGRSRVVDEAFDVIMFAREEGRNGPLIRAGAILAEALEGPLREAWIAQYGPEGEVHT